MPVYDSLKFILFILVSLLAYYLSGKFTVHKKAVIKAEEEKLGSLDHNTEPSVSISNSNDAAGIQWIILLITSLVYYAFQGLQYLIFIVFTAFTTWYAGLYFEIQQQRYSAEKKKLTDKAEKKKCREKYQSKKRLILILCLILNLGILAFFKYIPKQFRPVRGLLVPVGISFYTFQSLSYLIDSYSRKYPPEHNFFHYLLFVSWFPQLLEGPINRYDQLAPELLQHRDRIDTDLARRGMLQILYGFFKKLAIANLLTDAISLALDNVTELIPGSVVVVSILMYSAQQYADFSGGIDIVLGISKLYGVKISPNFKQPYFSVSLADFWRRWHITLGTWMRDYVFYPLALSRPMHAFGEWSSRKLGKKASTRLTAGVANIIVFLLVGLWHGPYSHYLLWGLYNGVVIAAGSLLEPVFQGWNEKFRIHTESRGFHIFRVLRTFLIVNIGWYFDRITRFGDCMICFRNTFTRFEPAAALSFWNSYGMIQIGIVVVSCLVVFAVSFLKETGKDPAGMLMKKNLPVRYIVVFSAFLVILYAISIENHPAGFMYANF